MTSLSEERVQMYDQIVRLKAENERLRGGVNHWLYDPWKYGMEGSISYFETLVQHGERDGSLAEGSGDAGAAG